jgi:hypothetical protein
MPRRNVFPTQEQIDYIRKANGVPADQKDDKGFSHWVREAIQQRIDSEIAKKEVKPSGTA